MYQNETDITGTKSADHDDTLTDGWHYQVSEFPVTARESFLLKMQIVIL